MTKHIAWLRILDRTNNFRNGLHLMTENLTHSGIKAEVARDDDQPFQLMAKLQKCHQLRDRAAPKGSRPHEMSGGS